MTRQHERFAQEHVPKMALTPKLTRKLKKAITKHEIDNAKALFRFLLNETKRAKAKHALVKTSVKARTLSKTTLPLDDQLICEDYAECMEIINAAKTHFKKQGYAFLPGSYRPVWKRKKISASLTRF
ncbi:MAG: hypothetical protein ACE5DI_02805 [Candidatus Micrarchaeia archaeon]